MMYTLYIIQYNALKDPDTANQLVDYSSIYGIAEGNEAFKIPQEQAEKLSVKYYNIQPFAKDIAQGKATFFPFSPTPGHDLESNTATKLDILSPASMDNYKTSREVADSTINMNKISMTHDDSSTVGMSDPEQASVDINSMSPAERVRYVSKLENGIHELMEREHKTSHEIDDFAASGG